MEPNVEAPLPPVPPTLQAVPPQIKPISRWYSWGFIFIPTVFCVVSFILFGLVFSCAFGGGQNVGCQYGRMVMGPFNLGSIIFLIFFVICARSDKHRSDSKLAGIMFWSYILAALLALGTPFFMNFLYTTTLGTETSCVIMGRIGGGCYAELAKNTDDINLCQKIREDDWYKRECLNHFAIQNHDVSLCSANDSVCIMDTAMAKKDVSLCSPISNEGVRLECYNNIAKEMNDPSLCLSEWGGGKYCGYVLTDPKKYTTASDVDVKFEIIDSDLKAGEHDVALVKVTMRASHGVAVADWVSFSIEGGSIVGVFPNMWLYKSPGNIQTDMASGGGSFSNKEVRPSTVRFYVSNGLVGDQESAVYLFRSDVSRDFTGKLTIVDVNAGMHANVKSNVQLIGSKVMSISK